MQTPRTKTGQAHFHLPVFQPDHRSVRPMVVREEPVASAPAPVVKDPALKASQSDVAALKSLEPTGERWEGYRPFKIVDAFLEADKQKTFILAPTDGQSITGFKPGQFLTFKLKVNGEEVVRSYSISDAQKPGTYQVTVKSVVDKDGQPIGKGSNYFHTLEAGAVVDVMAPAGQFFLNLEDETPAVFIAGGVGATPFLSMLKEVVRTGSKREIHMYYAVTETSEFLRADELKAIAAEHPNIHVHLVAGKNRKHDVPGLDFDHYGRISFALLAETLPVNHYEFLMCGPPGMMAAMTDALQKNGVPKAHIHTEVFGTATTKVDASPREQASGVGAAETVDVFFARTGKKFSWDPNAKSLLQAANEAGCKISVGCQQGVCGACAVSYEGKVTYPEGKEFVQVGPGMALTCVARASGPLKIK